MQSNKNNDPKRPNGNRNDKRRNIAGILSMILWALAITMLFRSCMSSYNSANQVMVDYSTFRQWVTEDKVDRVLMQSGKYIITLKDGVEVPGQTQSPLANMPWMVGQDTEPEYVTVPTPVSDLEIYSLMDAHGVE